MSAWIRDAESLRDFLGLAIVYAPCFPEEDYLETHEQLTLEGAFDEMRQGLAFVRRLNARPAAYAAAGLLLERAKSAYDKGDILLGSDLLQQLQRDLFY